MLFVRSCLAVAAVERPGLLEGMVCDLLVPLSLLARLLRGSLLLLSLVPLAGVRCWVLLLQTGPWRAFMSKTGLCGLSLGAVLALALVAFCIKGLVDGSSFPVGRAGRG